MTTPFDIATKDIFRNPDFTERAVFGAQAGVVVIASELSEDARLDEFGLDEGVSFFLRVRKADLMAEPKKNDLVTYRGTEYRVSSLSLDASGLVYRVYLKSKSTR